MKACGALKSSLLRVLPQYGRLNKYERKTMAANGTITLYEQILSTYKL